MQKLEGGGILRGQAEMRKCGNDSDSDSRQLFKANAQYKNFDVGSDNE
jgi:hypothetical protein